MGEVRGWQQKDERQSERVFRLMKSNECAITGEA
jgi:hypothetical protein